MPHKPADRSEPTARQQRRALAAATRRALGGTANLALERLTLRATEAATTKEEEYRAIFFRPIETPKLLVISRSAKTETDERAQLAQPGSVRPVDEQWAHPAAGTGVEVATNDGDTGGSSSSGLAGSAGAAHEQPGLGTIQRNEQFRHIKREASGPRDPRPCRPRHG